MQLLLVLALVTLVAVVACFCANPRRPQPRATQNRLGWDYMRSEAWEKAAAAFQ